MSKSPQPDLFPKVLGIYPQKQDGLFMQRVKIPGGRVNWPQWRQLAGLVARHSNGCALHVTTRQDVELHNIPSDTVPAVQQGLAEVGLVTFGACGDSVRNVTVCTGCNERAGAIDLWPVAQLVRQHLEQEPLVFSLPRKFKISFSGCSEACARPWLNDLGFVARPHGHLTVIGAGSLGARPALGIELYPDLPARDILPLCVAALEFFAEHGDRQNRRRARFRHIRERLGDAPFKAELQTRLEQVRARRSWPAIEPAPVGAEARRQHRLLLPDGNISPADALRLADAAERSDATLRIDLEHGLNLHGTKPVALPDDLARLTSGPIITACPGNATCPRGLADCQAVGKALRQALSGRDASNTRIAISGCPNGCAHSAAATIGLIGMVRTVAGRPAPHFQLLTGGGNGRNDTLASPQDVVPANDVPAVVQTLLT